MSDHVQVALQDPLGRGVSIPKEGGLSLAEHLGLRGAPCSWLHPGRQASVPVPAAPFPPTPTLEWKGLWGPIDLGSSHGCAIS